MKRRTNFEDIYIIILGIAVTSLFSILVFYGIQYIIYDRKDVNEDGEVNAQDYVEIKNYIMEDDVK